MSTTLRAPTTPAAPAAPVTAAERFAAARDRVHGTLPGRVRQVVPATAVGFAALSAFTYGVDLLLLGVGFALLGLPYPVAVTAGYAVALALAFVLNRRLNFRAGGHVGRQSGRYLLSVLANYALFVLLLSSTLEAVGVNYLVARLTAGACEAVFMYLMMRLVVFAQNR